MSLEPIDFPYPTLSSTTLPNISRGYTQIPALIVNSGDAAAPQRRAVFDSSIILQYLDSIADPRDTLYPPSSNPGRIDALSYEALADGILDAAWLVRAESLRVSWFTRLQLSTKCWVKARV